LPFLGSVLEAVDVVIVPLVAVVAVVPAVDVVPEVPEVSAVVNMSLLLVPVVADIVVVVDDIEVSVVTVSVLAFSSFLQPNASSATASKARNMMEIDFFIASLLRYI
jgi:hypothetical protein